MEPTNGRQVPDGPADIRVLTRREAADLLKQWGHPVNAGDLDRMARKLGGPRYFIYENRPCYLQSELRAWVGEAG